MGSDLYRFLCWTIHSIWQLGRWAPIALRSRSTYSPKKPRDYNILFQRKKFLTWWSGTPMLTGYKLLLRKISLFVRLSFLAISRPYAARNFCWTYYFFCSFFYNNNFTRLINVVVNRLMISQFIDAAVDMTHSWCLVVWSAVYAAVDWCRP